MTTVVRPVTAALCDAHGRHWHIPVTLTYDGRDPYAVTLDFPGQVDDLTGQPIRWYFARDLLVGGMDLDVGRGDVRIWPAGDRVCIQLTSPDGTCTFALPAVAVALFVADTYRTVHRGLERLDLDAIDRHAAKWAAEMSGGAC